MNAHTISQLCIALFGLSSIWLAMGNWQPGRRWAPLIGLCGQPFWFHFAWYADGWGIMALVTAYTAVYIRGAWIQWIGTQRVAYEQ